jgi:uncharacterized peroxidase-related enzyme
MTHHGEGLLRLTKDQALVDQLKQDYNDAGLGVADQAMLDYAMKLTATPGEMVESDIDDLRKQGFGDKEVLHINMITGYFAFVNRLADGLGVPLEDMWQQT